MQYSASSLLSNLAPSFFAAMVSGSVSDKDRARKQQRRAHTD